VYSSRSCNSSERSRIRSATVELLNAAIIVAIMHDLTVAVVDEAVKSRSNGNGRVFASVRMLHHPEFFEGAYLCASHFNIIFVFHLTL